MARVTYLLGAGASAGSLPTVDKFAEEILKIIKRLQAYPQYLNHYINDRGGHEYIIKVLNQVITDLQLLYNGCVRHRSVDTFAKKLYLTSYKDEFNEQYRLTKAALVLFFELYRVYSGNVEDKRYDAFLATILRKDNPRFPDDINILSWNYDYEIERAYLNYEPDKTHIGQVSDEMNIVHKNSKKGLSLSDKFGIIKINGTVGFYHKEGHLELGLGYLNTSLQGYKIEDITPILPIIYKYYDFVHVNPENYANAVSFAWEDDYGIVKVKDEIEKALYNTEIIVVIGYSFPYFNREMDAYIMKCFKNYAKGKVYVQAPLDNVGELIENVKELRDSWVTEEKTSSYLLRHETKFIAKTGLNQFYMSF